MANKLVKYFKRSLVKEGRGPATPAPIDPELGGPEPAVEAAAGAVAPLSDKDAHAQSFEDPSALDQLEGEIESITLDPEQKAELLKKVEGYAAAIQNDVLPMLRNIHIAVNNGILKQAEIELKGLTNIRGKLAEISEQLLGQALDNTNKKEKKAKMQTQG